MRRVVRTTWATCVTPRSSATRTTGVSGSSPTTTPLATSPSSLSLARCVWGRRLCRTFPMAGRGQRPRRPRPVASPRVLAWLCGPATAPRGRRFICALTACWSLATGAASTCALRMPRVRSSAACSASWSARIRWTPGPLTWTRRAAVWCSGGAMARRALQWIAATRRTCPRAAPPWSSRPAPSRAPGGRTRSGRSGVPARVSSPRPGTTCVPPRGGRSSWPRPLRPQKGTPSLWS
mmetsp:Transcript_19078/g.55469  ORF Transcript_19078/g.55469 Transcript_19078/m.55469 type:complete len:236 (+) Transcript_19078:157-864(+)